MIAHTLGALRQYTAAIAASLSVFIIGNWIAWPSSAVKHILSGETELSISSEEVSWAVALLDMGNIISPIPSSYISDWLGRKLSLVTVSFALLGSWLLTIFGTNAYYLYVARLLVGLCKGLSFTVAPIYLGEIASTNIRGGIGTIFCGMMNYGILYELCLGPLVSYETLNILSSPFPVIFFLLFLRFPESPYFLLMKGRSGEAKKSLAWFRNLEDDSSELEQELKQISASIEEDMKDKGGLKDLLSSSGVRRAMLIAMGLALFQRLSGMSSIIAFSSITLPPTGGYFSPGVYMIFFGVTTIVGQSICVTAIDRFGRQPLLIVSNAGCALSTAISAVFYWLSETNDLTDYNWVPYFCVILFGIMFAVGIGTIPSVICVELFSSDVRSYAASVAAIFYALGSFITNKLYLYVQLTIGVHYMFLFFTVSSLICLIFTCTVFFETNGKSFSDIQKILNNKSTNDKP
uniref:Major facilitator superfamily (MFS) profile domain-containing protein n=2 Tax=Graphocephala atropunctata TaxID=36148 RepID=A0A1B6LSE3_9HEMI